MGVGVCGWVGVTLIALLPYCLQDRVHSPCAYSDASAEVDDSHPGTAIYFCKAPWRGGHHRVRVMNVCLQVSFA